MSHITTYKKIHFDPINPNQEQICIEDIAHALSLICRANGHFSDFYSVAQHSINCMNEAKARGYSAKVQLACLLHDGSEAYLSDITRPVKKVLNEYLEIEDILQNLIWSKWLNEPLTEVEYAQVFQVDDALLYYEFIHFMNEKVLSFTPEIYSKPSFSFTSFKEIEKEFIMEFSNLI